MNTIRKGEKENRGQKTEGKYIKKSEQSKRKFRMKTRTTMSMYEAVCSV